MSARTSRWWTASRAGGGTSPARRAGRAPSTTGRFTPRTRARGRELLRRLDTRASRRLHRHPQHRDHRRPDDRGAPAHERSMAGSLRRRLGRCGGPALSRRANGTSPTPTAATATASCLFGPHGPRYRHPPTRWSTQVRRMPGISSVQITFHEDKDPGAARHAARRLPAGGGERLEPRGRRSRPRRAATAFPGARIGTPGMSPV